jgi:hypothetical protein
MGVSDETEERHLAESRIHGCFFRPDLALLESLGYGVYGPVVRILGIPYWAVLALVWAAILCLLQWIYLFRTPWSMSDEQLPDLMAQLEAVDIKVPGPPKGNQ